MLMFLQVQVYLAAAVTLIAAVIDYRTGKIPNWLTLPAVGLSLPAAGLIGGWPALQSAALGLAICGLVPALLYFGSRGQAIGGGDVKLFAALGALLGPVLGLEAQLYAYFFLGIFALGRLAWSGRLLATLANTAALMFNRVLPASRRRELTPELMTQMRMGPAIFVGCLALVVRQFPMLWL